MTVVEFEASTIADVMKKAARFSPKPSRSANLESPGIYMHILDDSIVVRATNLEIFIVLWSSFINKTGPAINWHMPTSAVKFCEHLSMTATKTVTFSDEAAPGLVTMTQGRTKGAVPLIKNFAYPNWNSFSEEDSVQVAHLGSKIDQVMWASASSSDQVDPAFQGIFMDGEKLVASDRQIAATVPALIPSIKEPMTVHAQTLADAIRNEGDVRITQLYNGLGISPDNYSQILCRSYASNPAGSLPFKRDYDQTIVINSEQVTNVIQRMLKITKGEDNLVVKLLIANEEVLFVMKTSSMASTEDVIEIPGYAVDTEPTILSFDPEILLTSFSKAPTHTVEMHYSIDSRIKSVYLRCGTYEAWFAQKIPPKNG